MPRKLTNEEALENIQNVCKYKDLEFLSFNTSSKEYEGRNSKLILKCSKCGKILENVWYNSLISRNVVHRCEKTVNLNMFEKYCIERIKHKLPKEFEFICLVGSFKTSQECSFRVRCKICGETFIYSYYQLLYTSSNFTCKKCHLNQEKYNVLISRIKQTCSQKNLTFLGFKEGKYINNKKTHVILQCNDCGYIWDETVMQNLFYKTIVCKECKKFWLMEKEIETFLKENNIHFQKQQTFEWLKYKNNMFLDFYIPSKNIAIECQGKQHFRPIEKFGGEKEFEQIQIRDVLKKQLCEEHNIKILYFSNQVKGYETFLKEKIIKNKEKILKEIING